MTNQPGIWSHLKDYEILPPQEAFIRLQEAIFNTDHQPSVSDPAATGDLKRLAQHESPPPPFLRAAIEERVRNISLSSRSALRPPDLRQRFLYRYAPAAACLLLLVSGWVIYRSHSSPATHTSAIVKTASPGPSAKAGDIIRDTLAKKEDSAAAIAAMAKDTSLLARTPMQGLTLSFVIDGQRTPVADNDLLVYFTSFTWHETPAYMTTSKNNDLAIKVDRYTNIHISPNMLGLMKQMYLFKPDGKPTRKARRAKEKLDRWRLMDRQRFDGARGGSSLDPIDLAEFIFK